MASAPHENPYSAAGVDTAAGDLAVELMKSAVKRTHGPEVLGGVGGFAGLFDASALRDYARPLLATSTDGVGTKVAIAQAIDKHDTIGEDLVGMVVDDIVVVGARPLFMTDYIACGKVIPTRIADIVAGIARGCELTGTALVGGETAEREASVCVLAAHVGERVEAVVAEHPLAHGEHAGELLEQTREPLAVAARRDAHRRAGRARCGRGRRPGGPCRRCSPDAASA